MTKRELLNSLHASDLSNDAIAEIAALYADAERWRFVRAADADNDEPYVAIQRRDSWGKSASQWLMHNDADAAVDKARLRA